MVGRKQFNIFRRGSKTYFTSSLLFPPEIRDKVFVLYAFVRVADDYVDSIPQQKKKFYSFVNHYNHALKGDKSGNVVVDDFVDLINKEGIKVEWVDAFLEAMRSDLHKKKYKTMKDLEKYMYGSAEVIGLMMAKIMNLPKKSYASAKLLGKSMQYANFLRDIAEDNALQRQYLPVEELKKYGFSNAKKDTLLGNYKQFEDFLTAQVGLIYTWQKQAEEGFQYIPKRLRVAVKTASEMYKWTVKEIRSNPKIIFSRKVKPSQTKILRTALHLYLSR